MDNLNCLPKQGSLILFTCGTYYKHPAVYQGIEISDLKDPKIILQPGIQIDKKEPGVKYNFIYADYVHKEELRVIPFRWIDSISTV